MSDALKDSDANNRVLGTTFAERGVSGVMLMPSPRPFRVLQLRQFAWANPRFQRTASRRLKRLPSDKQDTLAWGLHLRDGGGQDGGGQNPRQK